MLAQDFRNWLQNYFKAITTLQEAVTIDDGSSMHRDAIIQRFEYCTELSRKTVKKLYQLQQEDDKFFPKELMRKAEEIGLIDNATLRIDFIDERNTLSHNYNEERAQESYDFIVQHIQAFFDLHNGLSDYITHAYPQD